MYAVLQSQANFGDNEAKWKDQRRQIHLLAHQHLKKNRVNTVYPVYILDVLSIDQIIFAQKCNFPFVMRRLPHL